MNKVSKKLKITLKKIFNKKKLNKIDNLKIGSFKEWDSLTHFNLIIQIEKDFNIKFNTSDFSILTSIKEIKKRLSKKVVK